jgi:quercetin dioxygenase-like cupin family protein
MAGFDPKSICSAELVVPCENLAQSLAFYVDELGFRLELIFPADAPRVAVISGYGVRLRLDVEAERGVPILALTRSIEAPASGSAIERVSPDGTRIECLYEDSALKLPPLAATFLIQKANESTWQTGRAGMQYRDLIPDRLGGRYIASHIRIPKGGPVPDYVHHHRIRFQLIYCCRGWVRVVYEDQGPEIKMLPGDWVLQPPHIRHRVLEASDGMEVIEVSCPAEHMTFVDHETPLPTASVHPDRDFAGQNFVFGRAVHSAWRPGTYDGFEVRDLGLADATRGFATARVLRSRNGSSSQPRSSADCVFSFVLSGSSTLQCGRGRQWDLSVGDAFVAPAAMEFSLAASSPDLEMLQVCLG